MEASPLCLVKWIDTMAKAWMNALLIQARAKVFCSRIERFQFGGHLKKVKSITSLKWELA